MNFFKKLLNKIRPEKNELQDKPVELAEVNELDEDQQNFPPLPNLLSGDMKGRDPRKRKARKSESADNASFDQVNTEKLACFSSELIDFLKQNPNQKNMQLVAHLTKAVKFRIPDGGTIIDINKNGSLVSKYSGYIPIIKLPYETITLEFKVFPTQKIPTVLLCRQLEDTIEFAIFLRRINSKKWNWIGGEFIPLNCDWNKVDYLRVPHIEAMDTEEKIIVTQVFFANALEVILQFLAAMNCSNAEIIDDVKPDERLNKSRIRKGKTPMFEYKVLTIRTQRNGLSNLIGGNHASPRVHLRRGHIRKLNNKTVWVNACVVGDKTKGIIDKEYLVN